MSNLALVLLIVLLLIFIGIIPVWPHAAAWGYTPSGVVMMLILVIVILTVAGRL